MNNKVCNQCNRSLPTSEFYKNRARCKACFLLYQKQYRQENPERVKAWSRRWKQSNPEKVRANHLSYKKRARILRLQKKYGLSQTELDELFDQQQNQCAICKRKEKLVVDHNHRTGCVRGLLCSACNKALGFVKENQTILRSMIQYLESNQND